MKLGCNKDFTSTMAEIFFNFSSRVLGVPLTTVFVTSGRASSARVCLPEREFSDLAVPEAIAQALRDRHVLVMLDQEAMHYETLLPAPAQQPSGELNARPGQ